MNQFPPRPQSVPLGLFRIFSQVCGDIRKSRCTTGIYAIVVDTSGKFATGVNDTGGKYWDQYQAAEPLSALEGKNVSYKLTLLPKSFQTK
jgi:hypothetical protein